MHSNGSCLSASIWYILMKVGDLVYDISLKMNGIIIEVIDSVVPFRVLYADGHIDIACAHDLEAIDGYLV